MELLIDGERNGTILKYCAYIESVLCFLTNRHISKMQRKILLHDVREAQIHTLNHNQIRNRPIEI